MIATQIRKYAGMIFCLIALVMPVGLTGCATERGGCKSCVTDYGATPADSTNADFRGPSPPRNSAELTAQRQSIHATRIFAPPAEQKTYPVSSESLGTAVQGGCGRCGNCAVQNSSMPDRLNYAKAPEAVSALNPATWGDQPQALAATHAEAPIGPQKTCPVTGEPLGSMGTPVPVNVKGQTVLVCCEGCSAEVNQNPDKYLAKVAQEVRGQ